MFQRLKGAIDRTIAEEQARQQRLEAASSANRSASTSSRRNESVSGKRTRPKNPSSEAGDAAPNPDPAIFEAAFAIDDSEEPSRAGTPKPAPSEKDATNGEATGQAEAVENSNAGADGKDESSRDGHAASDGAAPAAKSTLPPEIRQKLRKLEKLESTYPELLKSYRVAHRRATAIEPFEKALKENTPLTSIGDPESLIEYLNQVNLKGDMLMDELKRVTAEKDKATKQVEEDEKKIKQLQDALEALKSEKAKETKGSATKDSGGDEEFFSYDDEIPKLQAEIASKDEEITSLKDETDGLKGEISALKQNGATLAEPSEASASQRSLQTQLDAQKTEIASLAERLNKSDEQRKALEGDLEKAREQLGSDAKHAEELLAKAVNDSSEMAEMLSKETAARNVSKNLIDELNTQVDALKKEKTGIQSKLDEVTKKLEETTKQPPAPAPTGPASTLAPPTTGGGGNKKKKKKGRGGGATSPAPPASLSSAVTPGITGAADAEKKLDTPALEAEITSLKEELADKDKEIERLSMKRKAEEDLREEIETLQENLINIGQDHVEDKARIKELEVEKSELKAEIAALEEKMTTLVPKTEASSNDLEKLQVLQKDYDSLREKIATLEADNGAAAKLSQDRFKDVTDLREALQKIQPELKSLRKDSSDLKVVKEQLVAKNKEISNLEKKEKDLERDLAAARQEVALRTSEIGTLKSRLAAETEDKVKLEEAQRVSGRELRRAVAEQIDLSAKNEKMERELQKTQQELSAAAKRLGDIENDVRKLRREKELAQEEAEFKTKQYTTAQGLLSSMRDQASEMTVQLKESQSQNRSLEEELGEVQHLLQERTRESETMRRLLTDSEQQAESKLREMRTRVETVTAERERLEEETSSVIRKNVKQSADLKSHVRELETEVKELRTQKDELEERERTWRRRREELEEVEQRTETESNELRNTVSSLRSALDASELQVRDGERVRANLRKEYDSLLLLHDKLSKELKSAQTKAAASASSTGLSGSSSGLTSRTSMDSTRTTGPTEQSDLAYIKTVLLQFLEQKDGKMRAAIVPVLGKLLKFDKADLKKWEAAIKHIEVR